MLGYDPPRTDTILKYMVKPRRPRTPSTTWLPFLRNHLDVSWAIEFCTVPTFTFRTLFIFIVLEHGRRRVLHWAVTPAPSMAWVVQQLREAMPYGVQPRYLFRDNDGIYGNGVRAFLDSCALEEVRTAFRSPWQNPFIERYVGTLRKELLDHVIVLNERHLERLLAEFVENYYHAERRTKDSTAPRPFRTLHRLSSTGPPSSSPRTCSAASITPAAESPPDSRQAMRLLTGADQQIARRRHVRLQSCAPGVCRSASRTPPPLTSPISHNLPALPSPPVGLRSFIPSTGLLGRTPQQEAAKLGSATRG